MKSKHRSIRGLALASSMAVAQLAMAETKLPAPNHSAKVRTISDDQASQLISALEEIGLQMTDNGTLFVLQSSEIDCNVAPLTDVPPPVAPVAESELPNPLPGGALPPTSVSVSPVCAVVSQADDVPGSAEAVSMLYGPTAWNLYTILEHHHGGIASELTGSLFASVVDVKCEWPHAIIGTGASPISPPGSSGSGGLLGATCSFRSAPACSGPTCVVPAPPCSACAAPPAAPSVP